MLKTHELWFCLITELLEICERSFSSITIMLEA
jgi:hypothetical protein